MAGNTASGRDAHLDAPLTNLAIKAFAGAEGFIADQLFPAINVEKESNKYYIIDPDSWLIIANTLRARKTSPRRVEWRVSSHAYFCDNYALAGENALEDLENADAALDLRNSTTEMVIEGLKRDMENRVALLCTSGTNIGSYVTAATGSLWSDYANSDPIAVVNTAHAFIQGKTGFTANVMVLPYNVRQAVRRHPALLDLYKYTEGGQLNDAQLAAAFGVDKILVPSGIKNNADVGATASMTNIWGTDVLLARVNPAIGLKSVTFGLRMSWAPAGLPRPMQVYRYMDSDVGRNVEIIQAGYYQDEKIVAKDLSYLIKSAV